jgi:hypothetical protein
MRINFIFIGYSTLSLGYRENSFYPLSLTERRGSEPHPAHGALTDHLIATVIDTD